MAASIVLEPFDESHVEDLAVLVADPAVQRFTRVPVPPPPGFARTFLASYDEGRRNGTREMFAVLDRDGGGFLGVAVAPRIDREARTAELGYVVARAARGRGVATAALTQLTEWGFSTLGALRLSFLISAENGASQRVATRCGYTREGLLRSLHIKQQLREDTQIWSRLPDDP